MSGHSSAMEGAGAGKGGLSLVERSHLPSEMSPDGRWSGRRCSADGGQEPRAVGHWGKGRQVLGRGHSGLGLAGSFSRPHPLTCQGLATWSE